MSTQQGKELDILEVPYRHTAEYLYSYGELSKFFKEVIQNKTLYATKCPKCNKVWMPPRGHCPDCYVNMDWVPLSGKGTIESAAYCFHAQGVRVADALGDLPFVLSIIKLDGTDTGFLHGVKPKEAKIGGITVGTRVKVVFQEERTGTIADFYFVIDEDK
jgi:uncharacterized protein